MEQYINEYYMHGHPEKLKNASISRSEIHQGTGASFKILTNRYTDTTI